MVGERCICVEGIPVRSAGANTSEHAGMSSDNWGENPQRRKPKVSDTVEPRKVSKFSYSCPYRKPTQVGGMSILRRVEELSSRNSAK